MSKAIVVVSFGTTYPETRRKTIEACEQAIQQRFSDYPVYRAFTSNVVRRRIKQQEGLDIPTVRAVLEQLAEQGTEEVYLQPLHVILGSEYEKILAQASDFQDAFKKLVVSKPLLHSQEDYEAVGSILLDRYGQLPSDAATVLMGHGSQHYAFTAYAALDHMMRASPVYVGCVESYPPVELIEQALRERGIREVHLAPFMLVAGDHATNDMSSDEEGSWYRFFKEQGYEVNAHLIGLGEYPEIQQLYIQHLEEIIE
ncbi:sirohydrochlorin cobaltochelatase [Streptococcus panodentis]|uniref:Sirohydrochlorin cobaltochelatase n=1 Tax=Streptococcus panodentis TaxID=1581472 RepID=A0ABS5ATZ7_9STRE|nr:sirohydrochlorin cobaltochelatase [Streptococcus panodentis]MBP2620047.1 sirohydrochlorin cobaltochelatase [Streptococcus panodentis]